MSEHNLIEKAKAYAQARYDEGYDTFVECYGNDEWAEFVVDYDTKEPMTWPRVKACMDNMAEVWADRRADAATYREDY